jgi:hypothetical protein
MEMELSPSVGSLFVVVMKDHAIGGRHDAVPQLPALSNRATQERIRDPMGRRARRADRRGRRCDATSTDRNWAATAAWTGRLRGPRQDDHDDGGPMKFLMLHYFDENKLDFGKEPDDSDPADRELRDWVSELESTGVKLHGGHLRPVREAVTLRIRAGERLLTDGPFAETKEQIAGFDVLECESLAEAIELAYRHPSVRAGTLELRPFWE